MHTVHVGVVTHTELSPTDDHEAPPKDDHKAPRTDDEALHADNKAMVTKHVLLFLIVYIVHLKLP